MAYEDNKITGWISIYRSLVEWEWYKDHCTKDLFIHCLLMANHTCKNWRGINIDRGSFVTSIEKLASEINFSEQQVRTALKKLKSTSEITIKTTNKYSIISIENYNSYQDVNTQDNKQITNKQQTNNKQITTTNNIIIKQVNNKNIYTEKISEYTCNEILQKTLIDFIDMRKTIKKPLTERAFIQLLSKLEKLGNEAYQVKCLEQSIFNCWQGIFEVKDNYQKNNNFNKKEDVSDINKRVFTEFLLELENERRAESD